MSSAHLGFIRIVLISVLISASCLTGTETGLGCGDFLSQIQKKPNHVEYLSCKHNVGGQSEIWQADYRVAGSHAAQVEQFFAKELKLKKLQRVCCIWESNLNFYHDKNGRLFEITMGSEETIISRRNQWNKVPFFYLTVELFKEEP